MTHLDGKQKVYPAGGTTSFESHNASPQDTHMGDGNVELGMEGIPTFSQNGQINDSGTHLSIAPSKVITLQEQKAVVLDPPNAKVAPSLQVESAIRGPEEIELPILCNSPSKVVRFVFSALRTILQENIPVADWDDNDYTDLAILAKSLHTGDRKLSDLVYQPDSPLVKEQTLIATAILAYIKMIDLKCKSDEELFEDWGNDRPLFFIGLRLEKLKEYPLFAEATQGL